MRDLDSPLRYLPGVSDPSLSSFIPRTPLIPTNFGVQFGNSLVHNFGTVLEVQVRVVGKSMSYFLLDTETYFPSNRKM